MSTSQGAPRYVLISQQEPNTTFSNESVVLTLTCSTPWKPQEQATFDVVLELEHAKKIGGQLPAAIVQVEGWRKTHSRR